MFELFLILLAGNLASLVSWLLKIPVGTGWVQALLAAGIYGLVAARGRPLLAGVAKNPAKIYRKIGLAVGAGLALTLPPMAFFIFPVLVSSLDYTPIKNLSLAALLFRLLVEIPFMTALGEELLFRHYLFEKFKKDGFLKTALLNSFIFTLWHLVVVMRTVLDTNLSQNAFLTGLSYLGGLVSVFVGGLVFGGVRYRTGSFLYSALTHWLNVALMSLAIWLL
jgi:membrane protease YdiL (CAAX protease family)